jgi:hypothetical protein
MFRPNSQEIAGMLASTDALAERRPSCDWTGIEHGGCASRSGKCWFQGTAFSRLAFD